MYGLIEHSMAEWASRPTATIGDDDEAGRAACVCMLGAAARWMRQLLPFQLLVLVLLMQHSVVAIPMR